MKRVHYSLQEARELLPTIKPILKKLIKCNVRLVIQNNMSIEYDDPYEDMKQSVIEAKQWHRAQHDYFKLLDKMFAMGIFVKDPAVGLVDFFSFHQGREIFLCYKYPEDTIAHWHELEDGFTGRKSTAKLIKRRTAKVR